MCSAKNAKTEIFKIKKDSEIMEIHTQKKKRKKERKKEMKSPRTEDITWAYKPFRKMNLNGEQQNTHHKVYVTWGSKRPWKCLERTDEEQEQNQMFLREQQKLK